MKFILIHHEYDSSIYAGNEAQPALSVKPPHMRKEMEELVAQANAAIDLLAVCKAVIRAEDAIRARARGESWNLAVDCCRNAIAKTEQTATWDKVV